jgi:outer membrane lipoprotein-sorting protein
MNQRMHVRLAVCAVIVLAVSSARAWQVTPQPFSADMTTTVAKGEQATGKFYFSPPKSRIDMSARGHDVIMISDSKSQTGLILMPQQHMYMETHAGQNSPMAPRSPKIDTNFDPSNPCAARPDVTCKKVATETVNGRSCDKWEFTDKKGATTTSWIDQKLHFPVKTVNADGSSVEFSNIKEGAPDAALFEVPAGYRKMDIPAIPSMGGRPPQ